MKIATIFFASPIARRAYLDALRERMYGAGYAPHYVTDYIRAHFGSKVGHVPGTDDAERAADVALELRGVLCKLTEDA